MDEDGNPVKDEKVTFYMALDNGGWESIATATTDSVGEADYTFVPEESGDYNFRVKVASKYYYSVTTGSNTATDHLASYTVAAGSPYTVEAASAEKYAEVDTEVKLHFTLKDSRGNVIGANESEDNDSADCPIKVTLSSVPDDSDLDTSETSEFTLSYDPDDEEYDAAFTPDEEGTYKVKAAIRGTAIAAYTNVIVKEFGTVKSLKLSLKNDRVGLKAVDQDTDLSRDKVYLEVKLVDENGVEKTADESDVKISTSSTTFGSGFNYVSDAFEVLGPKDADDKGVVTLTATELETGITASLDVNVTGGSTRSV